MADTKISLLPYHPTLDGSEVVPVAYSGHTYAVRMDTIANYVHYVALGSGSPSPFAPNTLFTSSTSGLVPASGGNSSYFLRADRVWATPPATTYAAFNSSTAGLTPASGGGTTNFLRADGTFATPPGVTSTFSSSTAGLTPASGGGTTAFLRADGTFAVPAGGTTSVFTAYTNGLAPSSGGGTTNFLCADGSFRPPYDVFTSYGPGLVPASGGDTTTFLRADGVFVAPPGGGGGLTNFTETLNTTSPNNTVNAAVLSVTGGTTNTDAVYSPKGTGALLTSVPDATSTGGNKRGTNAVDLQMIRSDATYVASGQYATISGGKENMANAYGAVVGGGNGNSANGNYATISGGFQSIVSAAEGTIGGGTGHTMNASATYGTISGGGGSTMTSSSASYATIGGGWTNSIAGSYGDYATISGGRQNSIQTSAAGASTVCGGEGNYIQGACIYGSILGGRYNVVTGIYASALGGYNNNADGAFSVCSGYHAFARGMMGARVHSSGIFLSDSNKGNGQLRDMVLRVQTTNATEAKLVSDLSGNFTATDIIMPTAVSAFAFKAMIVALKNDGSAAAAWELVGLAFRTATAGTIAFSGTPTVTLIGAAAPTGWSCRVAVNTSTNALFFYATGVASTTIRWVASIHTTEVGYL